MNRLLVITTVFFAFGIVITSFLKASAVFSFILLSVFLVISIGAYRFDRKEIKYIILLDFFLAGFLFGQAACYQVARNSLEGLENRRVILEGIIDGDNLYQNEKTYFTMRVSRISIGDEVYSVNQKVRIRVEGHVDTLTGNSLAARGVLLLPPIVSNPGEFSYRDYLFRQGIHYILKVNTIEDLTFLDYGGGNPITRIASVAKKNSIETISNLFEEPQSSLLAGIILGDSASIPDSLSKDFQLTGTFHIVAASGSNISILLVIIICLGELLRISYRRTAVLCIPVVIFYALIVGGQPSITRAAIMSVIVLLGLIIEKEPDLLTSLFGAAFLILVMEPLQLYDVGFQLSFAAVISIIYFTPPLQKILNFVPSREIRDCIAVSLAVQLGVAPIGIYYFNQLSLISVFANLLIFIFTGFSLMLGIFMLSLYPLFPFIGILLARVLSVLLDCIIFIVAILAKIPFAAINMATPSLFSIFIYYVILFLLFNFLRDYTRWKEYFEARFGWKKIAIAALGVILVLVWYPLLFPSPLKVVFLDVGQGDSVFLQFPDGETFLIDEGRGGETDYDAGKMVVAPFLQRQGIRQLTGIFLTHSDNDHLGGLLEVLREFKVKMVFDGLDFDPSSRTYKDFLFLVNKNGSLYYRLSAGNRLINKDGIKIDVLNPSLPLISSENHVNENCLVLRISWQRVSFLMAGDVEKEGEERILNAWPRINSDILKVAHHGSDSSTSEKFLQKVNPDVSIISVGEKNPYGHPSPYVLQRLQSFSSSVYRTDYNGAITVISDGKNYKVFTVKSSNNINSEKNFVNVQVFTPRM